MEKVFAYVGNELVEVDPGTLIDVDLGGDPERAAPTRVVKAPMFRKITDAEYEAYLQIRAGFPPRLQAIFDAAEPVIG